MVNYKKLNQNLLHLCYLTSWIASKIYLITVMIITELKLSSYVYGGNEQEPRINNIFYQITTKVY